MRVILSLPDEENAYQKMQADEARTTARRLHMDLDLLDGKGNAIEQVQGLVKAVHSEPTAKADARRAHDTRIQGREFVRVSDAARETLSLDNYAWRATRP